jgi:hypothetical protein
MPELDNIVMKALCRKPDKRYQNAHELQVDLTKYLSNNAPEYGGSNLAALVDKVLNKKPKHAKPNLDGQHLSKEDQLPDNFSLIFDAPDDPGPHPARLVVKNEDNEDEIHPLENELIIGRAGQLAVPDARVSRQHARIVKEGDAFLLEDLGSSNGTYLNDQRIEGREALKQGDRIRVGSFKMRFLAASVATASTAQEKPKITFNYGDRSSERVLEDELALRYRITVGPLRLEGTSGRIVRRENEVWVEPADGRAPVMYHGQQATKPLLLARGDSFELAGMTITYSG